MFACILISSSFPQICFTTNTQQTLSISTTPSPLTSHLSFAYYFLHVRSSLPYIFPLTSVNPIHIIPPTLRHLSAPVLLLPSANPSSLPSYSPISHLYLRGPPLPPLPSADLPLIGLLQLHLHDPTSCQTDPCLLRLTLSGPESGPEPGL